MKTKLPPDPEGLNDDRAKWAYAAVRAFQRATGTESGDAVADLLGDLMHLCDRHPKRYGTFETALDRARDFYEEETLDEASLTVDRA